MTQPLQPIEVIEHGREHSGIPLVVLHGGPGAPGSARGLALALAPRQRVLEPLQRWSGAQPLTVASHVADLAQIAPEKVVLIGHSWGAMLALSFAAEHAERVRGLVLVGCGTYGEPSREAYRAAFERCLAPDDLARRQQLRERIEHATTDPERDAIRGQLGALAAEAMSFDAVPDPGAYARVDANALEETWEDALRLQREGVEPARFASIRAPALMLHGDCDPHPGARTHAVLRVFVPHLEYVSFPHCGHEPWRERQAHEPFLRTLFAWLHAHSLNDGP